MRGLIGEDREACYRVPQAGQQFRKHADIQASIERHFPSLVGTNWRITSPYDDRYQCIAWAACWVDTKWWPGGLPPQSYWPPNAPDDESVDCFVGVFQKQGYEKCADATFEIGYQKVAIYADRDMNATHMARQHLLGRGWLSKLGDLEDIVHASLHDIEGNTDPFAQEYGVVVQIMKRSLLVALISGGLVRSTRASFRFLFHRLKHPRWCGYRIL